MSESTELRKRVANSTSSKDLVTRPLKRSRQQEMVVEEEVLRVCLSRDPDRRRRQRRGSDNDDPIYGIIY